MFALFVTEMQPRESDTVLDIGATSDRTYASSNYFEALYPYKHRVVAVGLQDIGFLAKAFPGVQCVQADILAMPFANRSVDLVHSSAVLEHVGSLGRQTQMIRECLRIARRGICLTTPNRWFPIEFHTQLPLVHWLPKPVTRTIFRRLGYDELAKEEHLNLMTERELRGIAADIHGWHFRFTCIRVLGWKSNLILFARPVSPSGVAEGPLKSARFVPAGCE
jgi:hypothetical protein